MMDITGTPYFETPPMPFGYYKAKSYIIQIDASLKHNPLQRHIWLMDDSSIEVGDWISTCITPKFSRDVENGILRQVSELKVPTEAKQLQIF